MIRPRKILLIITALGFWMILFYVIVTTKTGQQESHRKEVHKRLEDLENRAEAVVSDGTHWRDHLVNTQIPWLLCAIIYRL